MRNFTICFCLILVNLFQPMQAQEKTFFEEIEELEKQKEEIVSEEKEALKKKVEDIHKRLEENKINKEEAEQLKEEAARMHAENIESRTAIIDNKIALLSRNDEQSDDKAADRDSTNEEDGGSRIVFRWDGLNKEDRKHKHGSRTIKNLVLAAGFNNALLEGQSITDSDFKVGGSRFFEIGFAWKTYVFQNSDWLRIKYGVSFQFNGLKPTNNRFLVENGDLIKLEEHPWKLEKSKFRMDNLVLPVHLEFGPSSRKVSRVTREEIRYSNRDGFKIGVGAYAGLNLGVRQKLRYKDNGGKVKQKLKGDYNENEFIYGLSGYVGWGETALYIKYDLNPIFADPNAKLNNISVGLRVDLD